MIRRLTAVAALVAVQGLVLVGTASAEASSVRVERGQLIFQAAPGQANRLTVAHDGRAYVITDAVPMVPGPGCDRVAANQASCPSVGVTAVAVHLGDGDDTATDTSNNGITVNGGPGSDTLQGGDGSDTLNGDAGPDHLYGGPSTDWLDGGPGADQLYGESGDDFLDGGKDNDIVDGGQGMRDGIEYSDRTTAVLVTLADAPLAGTGMVGTESDKIFTVEDIVGGSSNDTLRGNSGNNNIWGGPGDDRLHGLAGDDNLHGQEHDFSTADPGASPPFPGGDVCVGGGQIGDTVQTCHP